MLLINNLMTVAHRRYIEIDVDNDAHQSCIKRFVHTVYSTNMGNKLTMKFFRLNAGNDFGIAWIYGAHSHRIVY